MKLLVCSSCLDILRIQNEVRVCACGQSAAVAHARHKVTITGRCMVMGLSSEELFNGARVREQDANYPLPVDAYLMRRKCMNVRRVKPEVFTRWFDQEIESERLAEAAR